MLNSLHNNATHSFKYETIQHIFSILLALSIVSIPTMQHGGQTATLFIFLLTPFLLFNRAVWHKIKEPLFQVFILFFLAAIPLAIHSSETEPLDVPSRYLIAALIFLALYRLHLPYQLILKAILLSVSIAFIASLLNSDERLEFGIGSIESGATLCIFFFFLVAFVCYEKQFSLRITAAALSLICIYLLVRTGTRGAWGSLIGTSLICGYLFYGSGKKLKYLFGVSLMLILLAVAYFNSPTIHNRTNSFVSDIQKLNSENFFSSTGQRVAVWKISIDGFLKSPVYGLSYKEIASLRDDYYKDHGIILSGSNDGRASSHNEILNIMLKQGSIGLIALILLYAVPIRFFYKKSKVTNSSSVRMYCFMGITLTTSVAISGLTEAILMHGAIATFYAVMLCLLYHAIRQTEAPSLRE